MAIPWLIGGAIAAIAAAVLSDNEEEEKKEQEKLRERKNEEYRLQREAEEKLKRAQQVEKQRVEKAKQEELENFAIQHANSIIQKYDLTDLSATHIGQLTIINTEAAEEYLSKAYETSPKNKSIQRKITDEKNELIKIKTLINNLEQITK
ncbi:hypothetical protein [Iodobacter sp.]|uniref:hypothetical protein n=1 Tax=Iodobacter sp. TaxID=1915058 RepID=UPI0025ECCE10|nr:hypothetical protein [Iodobacter sp.]